MVPQVLPCQPGVHAGIQQDVGHQVTLVSAKTLFGFYGRNTLSSLRSSNDAPHIVVVVAYVAKTVRQHLARIDLTGFTQYEVYASRVARDEAFAFHQCAMDQVTL